MCALSQFYVMENCGNIIHIQAEETGEMTSPEPVLCDGIVIHLQAEETREMTSPVPLQLCTELVLCDGKAWESHPLTS